MPYFYFRTDSFDRDVYLNPPSRIECNSYDITTLIALHTLQDTEINIYFVFLPTFDCSQLV